MVDSAMNSRSAIRRFEQPSARSPGTSRSALRAIGADRPACGHDGVVDDRLAIIVQREMSSCFRHI
jgi:hypothetical protein